MGYKKTEVQFANQLDEINKLKSELKAHKQEISTLQLRRALSTEELSRGFKAEKSVDRGRQCEQIRRSNQSESKGKSQEALIKTYKGEITRLVRENHRLLLQYNECSNKLELANATIKNIRERVEVMADRFADLKRNINKKLQEIAQRISPLAQKISWKISSLLEETVTTSSKLVDSSNILYNKYIKLSLNRGECGEMRRLRENNVFLAERQKGYARIVETLKQEIESIEAENLAKVCELERMNKSKTQNLKKCISECRKLKNRLERVSEERNRLNSDIEELRTKCKADLHDSKEIQKAHSSYFNN